MGNKINVNINSGNGKSHNGTHKEHTLLENLLYAQELGLLDDWDVHYIVIKVGDKNLHHNRTLANRVFDIIKTYKAGIYDKWEAANKIHLIFP